MSDRVRTLDNRVRPLDMAGIVGIAVAYQMGIARLSNGELRALRARLQEAAENAYVSFRDAEVHRDAYRARASKSRRRQPARPRRARPPPPAAVSVAAAPLPSHPATSPRSKRLRLSVDT